MQSWKLARKLFDNSYKEENHAIRTRIVFFFRENSRKKQEEARDWDKYRPVRSIELMFFLRHPLLLFFSLRFQLLSSHLFYPSVSLILSAFPVTQVSPLFILRTLSSFFTDHIIPTRYLPLLFVRIFVQNDFLKNQLEDVSFPRSKPERDWWDRTARDRSISRYTGVCLVSRGWGEGDEKRTFRFNDTPPVSRI